MERAQILLRYANGQTVTEIHQALRISRPTIDKCIDKALAGGAQAGLKDRYHRPREPLIGEPENAGVTHLACQKPTDLGMAAEWWTLSALARAGKATIWRILNERAIHPHRMQYDLERRNPDFETKMREVLMVDQEVALQNARAPEAPP